jgi:hypothetical protein
MIFNNLTIALMGLAATIILVGLVAIDIRDFTWKLGTCLSLGVTLAGFVGYVFGVESFIVQIGLGVMGLAAGAAALMSWMVKVPDGKMQIFAPTLRSSNAPVKADEFHIVAEGERHVWAPLFEEFRAEVGVVGAYQFKEWGPKMQFVGGEATLPLVLTFSIDTSPEGLERWISSKRPDDALEDNEAHSKYIETELRTWVEGRFNKVARDMQILDAHLTPNILLDKFRTDDGEVPNFGWDEFERRVKALGLKDPKITAGDLDIEDKVKENIRERTEAETVIENATRLVAASGLPNPDERFKEMLRDQKILTPQVRIEFDRKMKPAAKSAELLAEQQAAAGETVEDLEATQKARYALTPKEFEAVLLSGQKPSQRDTLSPENHARLQNYSEERAKGELKIKRAKAAMSAGDLTGERKASAEKYESEYAEARMKTEGLERASNADILFGKFLEEYLVYKGKYAEAFESAREFVAADPENTQRISATGFKDMFTGTGVGMTPDMLKSFLNSRAKK